MRIGQMQHLKLSRFVSFGAYLIDDNGLEVLLPKSYLDSSMQINSLVWVFVYTDSEDRIVAITTIPKAFLGDIVGLEVASIANNGIYLDMGIPKDIFMPSKNPKRYQIGDKVVVKITLDKQNRLIARQNLSDYLRPFHNKGDKVIKNVKILPFLRTPLGINCVVNGKYFGMLYHSDIKGQIPLGIEIEGGIKKIRTDGKLDLILKPKDAQSAIFGLLKSHNNKLNLHFDSPPEQIFDMLGISKKSFKTTISRLIKQKKVQFIKKDDEYFLSAIKES